MKKLMIGLFTVLCFTPVFGWSHDLAPTCKDNTLIVTYDDGSPASGATVYIINEDWKVLKAGKTDKGGMWSLPGESLWRPTAIAIMTLDQHKQEIPLKDILGDGCSLNDEREKLANEKDTKSTSYGGPSVLSTGGYFKGRS